MIVLCCRICKQGEELVKRLLVMGLLALCSGACNSMSKINTFSAEPSVADWNQPITLSWNVSGATRLRFAAFTSPAHGGATLGELANASLPEGTMQYTIRPNTISPLYFTLEASNDQGWTQVETIAITVRCPYAFITSDHFDSGGNNTCPVDNPTHVAAVYQPLEHGLFLRAGDTNTIYLLTDSGTILAQTMDTWHDGEPSPVTETPPSNRFLPSRGFGKIWIHMRDFSAQSGIQSNNVGWAVAPEQDYSMQLQWINGAGRDGPVLVMSFPDARLIVIDSGHWEVVSGPETR